MEMSLLFARKLQNRMSELDGKLQQAKARIANIQERVQLLKQQSEVLRKRTNPPYQEAARIQELDRSFGLRMQDLQGHE